MQKMNDTRITDRFFVMPNILQSIVYDRNQFQQQVDSQYLQKWQKDIINEQLVYMLTQNVSFNRPKGQLGHTNGVLLNRTSDQNVELFLPGYLRMKIRNLVKVDIAIQQTTMNALIQFSINYSKLPRPIVDLLKNKLVMRFSKKNSILLKETQQQNLSIKVTQNNHLQLINFSINMPLTFHFQPYYPFSFLNLDVSIWFSPFQKIKNVLTISLQDLAMRYDDIIYQFFENYSKEQFDLVQNYFKELKRFGGNIKKLTIKVNLMDLLQPQIPKKNQETQYESQNFLKIQLSEKYKQLSSLYTDFYPEQNQSLYNHVCFDGSSTQKECLLYELRRQLSELWSSFPVSSNKLTYEEEHLFGQYQIASSELKVRFSCYKYLTLKKKIETQMKIYKYIQQLKKNTSQFKKIQTIKKAIIKKIFSKELQQRRQNALKKTTKKVNEKSPLKRLPTLKHVQSQVVVDETKMIKIMAQEIRKQKEQVMNFQFAHFQLPIYKHPFVPLGIVFLPLWIIAFINLIIYFSPHDLGERIANIAILLISYVAYFPTFRQQIPEYRYLLLAEILAYLQIFCSFLTLIHSLIDRNNHEDFSLDTVGPFFWISFAITVFSVLIVVIGYTFYKFWVQPHYKIKQICRKMKRIQTNALRHIIWNNYQCDLAFIKQPNLVLLEQIMSFNDFIKQSHPNSKIRTLRMKMQTRQKQLNQLKIQ